jgi:hypothetical protein
LGIEAEKEGGKPTGKAKAIEPISGWTKDTVKQDIHNNYSVHIYPFLLLMGN